MDEYTKRTRAWLDERFRKTDEQGIYIAYQPIYGFRKGHSEQPGLVARYIATYQVMKALSHLKFDSLLDVGGAEGYTAFIVRELFGVRVKNSDLSEEACKRAREIFHLESDSVDIHELPYQDSKFDIVLCRYTLEHAKYLQRAIDELLRVASKAVVITVPHEDRAVIEKNIEEGKLHDHINAFTLSSFDFLKSKGYDVIIKRMLNLWLIMRIIGTLAEAYPGPYSENSKYPKSVIAVYNSSVPILRRLLGKRAVSLIIHLDDFISNFSDSYDGILCTILKDKACYSTRAAQRVSASRIISYSVPYHYLKAKG